MTLTELKNLGYGIHFNFAGYVVNYNEEEIGKVCNRYNTVTPTTDWFKQEAERLYKERAIEVAMRHYSNNQPESA